MKTSAWNPIRIKEQLMEDDEYENFHKPADYKPQPPTQHPVNNIPLPSIQPLQYPNTLATIPHKTNYRNMKDWLDNQRKSAAAQVKSAEKAVPDN